MSEQSRKLAAILFTDIVGSTTMMQHDEQTAIAVNKRYAAVLKQFVSLHHGEILNDFGDGSLCTFSSATQAVRCAIEMQLQFQMEPTVPLRIGLHVGEIFFEGGKVFGDGVNIASRIQSLGIANSILFSAEINSKLKNQQEFISIPVGRFHFKNIDEPMDVFAISHEGITVPKKEDLTGKLKEMKKKPARKKWIVAAAVLVLLVIAFLFITNVSKNKKGLTGKERSIVILPFDNYSNDPEQENFINGITEEITTQLSKIADIKVIGRNSAALYKKSKKPLDQIAEDLGVSAYLEGSVQKVENQVRITAQLIDANTQQHIWADRYDRELKDIFLMQSEVAQEIAGQLHANLTEEEKNNLNKKPTENIEAYKLYRKGRHFWDTRTKASFDSAEAYYKRAIELDPGYALAYAGLADCYTYNQKGLTQLEAIPIGRDYAMKALSLDSNLSEALTTLGLIQSIFDYDWVQSKKTLEKAIRLNPNYAIAHLYYGNLLQYTGQSKELGIKEVKKALALDPLSVQLNWVLGRNYWMARENDLAFEQLKRTLALEPANGLAKGTMAHVLLAKKKYAEAFELIRQFPKKVLSKSGDYQGPYLIYAYAVFGDTINARKELEKTLLENPDQNHHLLARAFTGLKDHNNALNELEVCYKIRNIGMYFLKVDPIFDPIRNEPRFKALIKKMRLG